MVTEKATKKEPRQVAQLEKDFDRVLSPSIGVALSGGGVRASLFALGTLLYLVDTKLNSRVSEISSVSGGSITNAFIAQRCDFQKVQPPEFERHASELAVAITEGLVTKNFIVATYVVVGLLVLLITGLSWPLRLPICMDALLIFAYGWMLLLRGIALVQLLQRRLFAAPDLPKTLGGIKSSVAHIFCATDLNSSMPVYFTNGNPHFLSLAWGEASREKAADIRIVDAVRASAAFPGGIPPKRLNVEEFGVVPTPLQKLQRWQQLAFRDVMQQPSIVYLADGGVWNNLGTDWFEHPTRVSLLEATYDYPPAERLIVVDATAPTAAKTRLNYLRFPWLAEVLALFRVLIVSYTSSVTVRIQDLSSREETNSAETKKNKWHPALVRMIEPMGGFQEGGIAWLGYNPSKWSGRWSLMAALNRFPSLKKQWIVRGFDEIHKWNSRVPTTLFRIPSEVALQLLIHGYVSTGQAIAETWGDHSPIFPGVPRFAKLLGLKADRYSNISVTVLKPEPISDKQLMSLRSAVGEKVIDRLEETNKKIETAIKATEEQHEKNEEILKMKPENLDFTKEEALNDLSDAVMASINKDFSKAIELFNRAFTKIDLSDASVDAYIAAQYAYVLAKLSDPRASRAALTAEQKAERQVVPKLDEEKEVQHYVISWYNTAEAYGLLKNTAGVVRCLQVCVRTSRDAVKWLADCRKKDDDPFAGVRCEALFDEFEAEVLSNTEWPK